MGAIYRPKYRDRHGVIQESEVWWVRFRQHGETARQDPTLTTLRTLARALGVTVSRLIGERARPQGKRRA